jgi:hypothetical protein
VTLQATADSINAQFKKYGLDHDVVKVSRAPGNDRMEQLVLIDGYDPDAMALLNTTLTHVFDVYFDSHPPSAQLRLF